MPNWAATPLLYVLFLFLAPGACEEETAQRHQLFLLRAISKGGEKTSSACSWLYLAEKKRGRGIRTCAVGLFSSPSC